jgi:hypothetical protein
MSLMREIVLNFQQILPRGKANHEVRECDCGEGARFSSCVRTACPQTFPPSASTPKEDFRHGRGPGPNRTR